MWLKDKRCLIVGGTSGIGLAASRRFLEEGARLVVAGKEAPRVLAARVVLCDVTLSDEVDALFADCVSYLGGLDVLYHVAGSSGRRQGDGPLHECTEEGWHSTLDANLKSTFLTNRAALRHFLGRRQAGVILNMASVLGLAPSPHHFDTAAYTAAKGGVIALSRLAAARYAADSIRVNVLAPGLVDTPMTARAIGNPDIRAFLGTKQPLAAGPARPEDVADAAVFLCSDAARLVTGVVLPVDGGWCVSEGQRTDEA
jgi:NAD(P)-dependent dehydrogenase (short-subunit alcohol dehydrogenase family)